MKKYKFYNNNFYPYPLKGFYEAAGTWPEGGVDIDEVLFTEFSGTPPTGKERGSNSDGMPSWVDLPPPTLGDLIAIAENIKSSLKAKADSEIAWRQDSVDADMATEDEISQLSAWKKYRVLLMRTSTSTAPSVNWPCLPDD